MTAATPNVQQVQASTYLAGATDVTLRKRLLLGWLDREGRINKKATGKDMNWKLKYKNPTAQSYTPGQTLTFQNDNYWLAASVTPEWWHVTSGMDITEEAQNSGPAMVIDSFADRAMTLAQAMETRTAKDLYSDYSSVGAGHMIGLASFCKKSGTVATTNGDRIAPPDETVTYAGLNIGLGSQGGSWSHNIIGSSGHEYPMNTALGTDWPDGQGDSSQRYDGTSPRLYNENSSRWADPAASAANSTWRANCLMMLSRANTDLAMNSVESMMPTIHIMPSGRMQSVKDKLREAFRDTMDSHGPSENLGYRDVLSYEGAALQLDYEVPANVTYSLCAESLDMQFYSDFRGTGSAVGQYAADSGTPIVTGGIYTMFGPVMPPTMLSWVWILFTGGNTRYSPKWVVCHKDWT